jgi:hypothetical protein
MKKYLPLAILMMYWGCYYPMYWSMYYPTFSYGWGCW